VVWRKGEARLVGSQGNGAIVRDGRGRDGPAEQKIEIGGGLGQEE